jgi:predicted GH43/DUF377 family glycosyl hydrolase
METLALLVAVQIFFTIYQLVYFRNLKSCLSKVKSKSLILTLKNEELLHSVNLSLENLVKTRSLPSSLIQIPFADDAGIVLSVKKIKIPSVTAAYNASLGSTEQGHILFFRYDSPSFGQNLVPFFSHVGCIHLDAHFEPLEKEFSKIETQSAFSEDARFFQNGDRHFLIYNDLVSDCVNHRGIRIGAIDVKKKCLEYVTSLNVDSSRMEKNWTPFSHRGEIHFLHTIDPQKILALPDPRKNLLREYSVSPSSQLEWTDKWSALRGGTPAVRIDDEYLAFFHSSFDDRKGIIWYVCGAYTFASSHPFKLSRISPHPILFKGIYDTVHQTLANPRVRALYPTGLICEKGDLIHVSCGENDSGIKIVTMDKQKLLASLREVKC